MKNFKILALVGLLGLLCAAPVFASGGECESYTTCQAASAGAVADGSGPAPDARPSDVVETNSASIMLMFWIDPDGTDDDTGTEVAALLGVDCVDVILVAEAGGSGDELTAATCSTDLTGLLAIMIAN